MLIAELARMTLTILEDLQGRGRQRVAALGKHRLPWRMK